jgi:hypothetical protein
MNGNRKDFASGIIYIGAGAFYLIYALKTLSIGQALNMGPGYFPVVLSSIVIMLGIAVVVRSFIYADGTPFGIVPWRAVVMITLSLIFFALFLRYLGMGPTVLITVVLACTASPKIRPIEAAVTGVCVAFFCWLVFTVGVGLPIPLFGRLFEGTFLAGVEAPVLAGIHTLA